MTHETNGSTSETTRQDLALLSAIVEVTRAAAARLRKVFTRGARPIDRAEMFAAAKRNEAVALPSLREALSDLRPQAGWVDHDNETKLLPPGEWWAVDAVEGNVNHIHGLSEWCVSTTLVRDNTPVVAVVHQAIGDRTFTAVRGGGAQANGVHLRVSQKKALEAAIVATGQAEMGQRNSYRRIGESITVMLGHALLVQATVPSTFPMLHVAAGHSDVFWQYEPVLPGVAAGILLVTEAGGVATRVDGSPWQPGSPDILVAAPGLHRATVNLLAEI